MRCEYGNIQICMFDVSKYFSLLLLRLEFVFSVERYSLCCEEIFIIIICITESKAINGCKSVKFCRPIWFARSAKVNNRTRMKFVLTKKQTISHI